MQIKTTRYRLSHQSYQQNFFRILEQITHLFANYHPPEENLTSLAHIQVGHSICVQAFIEGLMFVRLHSRWTNLLVSNRDSQCRLLSCAADLELTSSGASVPRCPTGTSNSTCLKSNPSSYSSPLMFLVSQPSSRFLCFHTSSYRGNAHQ